MENSIKFIPTLTPTFEQWKSLPMYLAHHETSLQRRFGAVKLLPPSRWVPLLKNPYDLRHIKVYIKQTITRSSHQSNVFYIHNSQTTKRRFMTYDECKTIAESDAYRLKDTINDNPADYFWSTITTNISLHVSNMEESLFSKRENVFNMASLASLLKYYPKPISGVTTPFLHMGMWSSSVGLHIDDHDLISLNYLHHGAPKIWYIIHPSSYTKLEELVNELKLFSDITSSCLSPLQHKSLLINPSFLQRHSIEYYQIEQKLNELVVVFPGTYHFYFDTGFNLSESVKYALPSWLQFQRRSPRLCSCSASSANLISLNRRFFTNDILHRFEEEHLTSTAPTCIDLSKDDENSTNQQTIVDIAVSPASATGNHLTTVVATGQPEFIEVAHGIDTSLDQYTDPLYSTSSNSNTPLSNDLVPATNNFTEQEEIWNIFEQISSQMNSDSMTHQRHAVHYHPYKSFTSIHSHASSIYSTYLTPYSYSSLRSCHNERRLRRRKCYGCRRQGHLRKECPYFPHE